MRFAAANAAIANSASKEEGAVKCARTRGRACKHHPQPPGETLLSTTRTARQRTSPAAFFKYSLPQSGEVGVAARRVRVRDWTFSIWQSATGFSSDYPGIAAVPLEKVPILNSTGTEPDSAEIYRGQERENNLSLPPALSRRETRTIRIRAAACP